MVSGNPYSIGYPFHYCYFFDWCCHQLELMAHFQVLGWHFGLSFCLLTVVGLGGSMVGGVLSLFSRALLIFFSAHVATLSFFFFGGSSSRSMPAVDLELRLGVGGTVTPSPTEAGSEREEGPPILQLVVGGDSVESILRRLLRHSDGETLDPAAYNLARAEAQDRFEIQVEIIQLMAVLDHPGCRSFWIQHGARALDNPPISKG